MLEIIKSNNVNIMSTTLPGTKEALDDLAEDFAVSYPLGTPIQYDDNTESYFMVVCAEDGDERVDIEDKYYPIISRFIV